MVGSSSNNPSGFAISGMLDEVKMFTWKVDNIVQIMDLTSEIGSESFEFQAGDTIGMSSIWTAAVERRRLNSEEYVTVSMKLTERPSANSPQLLAECSICKIDSDGKEVEDKDTVWPITDVYNTGEIQGWEFKEKFGPNPVPISSDLCENFVLRVGLRLYGPRSAHTPNQAVEELLEQFQVKSRAQARTDMSTLLRNPVAGSGNDVKIITNEGKEIIVQKCFLAARNPVFKAMHESNMIESQSGVINLPDMSAATLHVLLHFFYTGDLLPQWCKPEVVVELTNAAAKYQIGDLLQFLDTTLGRVCELQNVIALLTLADQLNLKTAEKQLMGFLRKNGLASAQNFFQIVEAVKSVTAAGEKQPHDGDDEDDGDKPDN